MATSILRAQPGLCRNRYDSDLLTALSFGSRGNPNANPNSIRPRRRNRSPGTFRGEVRHRNRVRDRTTMVAKLPSRDLVMGQVKILKRDEALNPNPAGSANRAFGDNDLALSSTDRLGPEPDTVQKQIRVSDLKVVDGLYAGSAAFFASPPPSSLPFPAFFSKKERNDAATSDLRRLLRLDALL